MLGWLRFPPGLPLGETRRNPPNPAKPGWDFFSCRERLPFLGLWPAETLPPPPSRPCSLPTAEGLRGEEGSSKGCRRERDREERPGLLSHRRSRLLAHARRLHLLSRRGDSSLLPGIRREARQARRSVVCTRLPPKALGLSRTCSFPRASLFRPFGGLVSGEREPVAYLAFFAVCSGGSGGLCPPS